MPRGDQTGPNGMGPMTGRGAGYCAGYAQPGYVTACGGGMGRGGGRGFGGGRGWRNRFHATGRTGWQRAAMGAQTPTTVPTMTKEQELQMLRTQSRQIQQTLDAIQQRIDAIDNQDA